jgi:hypothetical protein
VGGWGCGLDFYFMRLEISQFLCNFAFQILKRRKIK